MVEDHHAAVAAEPAGEAHRAGRDRPHRGPERGARSRRPCGRSGCGTRRRPRDRSRARSPRPRAPAASRAAARSGIGGGAGAGAGSSLSDAIFSSSARAAASSSSSAARSRARSLRTTASRPCFESRSRASSTRRRASCCCASSRRARGRLRLGARLVERPLLVAEARDQQAVVREQLAERIDAFEQLAQALRREHELRRAELAGLVERDHARRHRRARAREARLEIGELRLERPQRLLARRAPPARDSPPRSRARRPPGRSPRARRAGPRCSCSNASMRSLRCSIATRSASRSCAAGSAARADGAPAASGSASATASASRDLTRPASAAPRSPRRRTRRPRRPRPGSRRCAARGTSGSLQPRKSSSASRSCGTATWKIAKSSATPMPPADRALHDALDQEWDAQVRAARADQREDLELVATRVHREPDRVGDDQQRREGEHESESHAGAAHEAQRAAVALDPGLPARDVLDAGQLVQRLGHGGHLLRSACVLRERDRERRRQRIRLDRVEQRSSRRGACGSARAPAPATRTRRASMPGIADACAASERPWSERTFESRKAVSCSSSPKRSSSARMLPVTTHRPPSGIVATAIVAIETPVVSGLAAQPRERGAHEVVELVEDARHAEAPPGRSSTRRPPSSLSTRRA